MDKCPPKEESSWEKVLIEEESSWFQDAQSRRVLNSCWKGSPQVLFIRTHMKNVPLQGPFLHEDSLRDGLSKKSRRCEDEATGFHAQEQNQGTS